MKTKIFSKISQSLLAVLIFLVPFFFLPFTTEFFSFPKINLFLIGSLLIFFFWLTDQVANQKFSFQPNRFLYPLFLLFGANFVSIIINWPNLDKFSAVWSALPFLFLPLFSFLLKNSSLNFKLTVKNLLLISCAIVSLVAIILFLLPAERYPLNLSFLGFPLVVLNHSFSSTGNALISLIFLLSLVPYLVKDFADFFNQENKDRSFFLWVILRSILTLIIITGAGIFLLQTVSVNKPLLLPYRFGWSISLETLKNPLNALFGVGPGNFASAFTRFKPVSFNYFDLWSVRFLVSSSEFFQILTTLGLFGLAVYFYLYLRLLLNFKKWLKNPAFFGSLIILISFLFLPANFLFYFLLVIFLSLIDENQEENEIKSYSLSQEVAVLVFGLNLLAVVGTLYLLGRNLAADIYLQRSLITASRNLGSQTYNLQIKAISLNPYRSDSHLAYSQTNLALANAMAVNPAGGSLSDQDKQTITQLVQQAIREARNTAALAPLSVVTWENLASTYRQLTNFAQGADQWAIASFTQAIRLDPNNPQHYLNIGGLYYALEDYEKAINFFQTSVNLKPDFANGYYNLAAAFKKNQQIQKAYDALSQAGRLVTIDSVDYQKVQKELEEIRPKLPKTQTKPTETEATLNLPEPLPTITKDVPAIELPNPETTPPEE